MTRSNGGQLPEPEGHRTLRAMMQAGEQAPPIIMGEVVVLRDRVLDRAESVRWCRRMAVASFHGADFPPATDIRTHEQRGADGRRLHGECLWHLELLTDDEVAGWFRASLPADVVEYHRAHVAEDLAAMHNG